MKTATKVAITTAAILLVLGIILGTLSIIMMEFDFKKLVTQEYKTVTYDVTESFDSIVIGTDVSDVTFLVSENDCKVVCDERENVFHSIEVQNGCLIIKTVDNRKWYEHIGIFIGDLNITVYLPETELDDLKINTDTGNVELPRDFSFSTVTVESDTGNISCYASVADKLSIKTDTGNVKAESSPRNFLEIDTDTGNIAVENLTVLTGEILIESDTGDVRLTNATGKSIKIDTDTGNVILTSSAAIEDLKIETSTGNVIFNNADAKNIYVNTNTGNVKGTLTTEKIFYATSSTGNISLPRTSSGGICEIKTDTGDIKLDIAKTN